MFGGAWRLLGRASGRCRGPLIFGPLVRILRLPALPFNCHWAGMAGYIVGPMSDDLSCTPSTYHHYPDSVAWSTVDFNFLNMLPSIPQYGQSLCSTRGSLRPPGGRIYRCLGVRSIIFCFRFRRAPQYVLMNALVSSTRIYSRIFVASYGATGCGQCYDAVPN